MGWNVFLKLLLVQFSHSQEQLNQSKFIKCTVQNSPSAFIYFLTVKNWKFELFFVMCQSRLKSYITYFFFYVTLIMSCCDPKKCFQTTSAIFFTEFLTKMLWIINNHDSGSTPEFNTLYNWSIIYQKYISDYWL